MGSWLQPEHCQSAPENRNSEDEMRSVAQAAQGEEACGADSDTGTSSLVVSLRLATAMCIRMASSQSLRSAVEVSAGLPSAEEGSGKGLRLG